METESDFLQSPKQSYRGKEKSTRQEFDPSLDRENLLKKFPTRTISRFHADPDALGNLEFLIADDDDDLSSDLVLSFFTTPEERAYKFMDSLMPFLFHNFETTSSVKIFLKHTLQSLLGTHCVFGLQQQGFEIEEHSFVVHVDKNNRVVMISCTYLPNLPELLNVDAYEPVQDDKIRDEIEKIGEYDRADGEKLWLVIWDAQNHKFQVAPGNQVKLSLPTREPQKTKPPAVLRIPTKDYPTQQTSNSPGLSDKKLGLGEVIRDFLEIKDQSISILDDEHIKKYDGILQDLESDSELKGRYAAIKDEIDSYIRDKGGIFTNESESAFDRVTAYYHLDYIQRYFRENLGFQLLDDYPQLNPVQLLLAYKSDDVAQYDVNSGKIIFYQLASLGFTAVRDPRLVYHEFVHVVTDAIARLHRAGQLLTPRSKEILQAQAMDEGIADYFASSLAKRQGAKKALAYYLKSQQKWGIVRDLDPGTADGKQEPIKIAELNDGTNWKKKKYELGELWGRYLWQLRQPLGAEIADILVAYSLFFLTRWGTFEQGLQALQLADRLLFSAKHQQIIVDKAKEALQNIEFI